MSSKKMFLIMLITLILITMGGAWASDDYAMDEISAADDDAIAVDSVDDTQKDTSIIKENLTSQKTEDAVKTVDSDSNEKGEILGATSDEDVLGAGFPANWTTDYQSNGITLSDSNVEYNGNGHYITGNNNNRILTISSGKHNITFKNIIFKNGKSDKGGAIYVASGCYNITFINCTFQNNLATPSSGTTAVGGAIFMDGTSGSHINNCNFTDCIFSNNKCEGTNTLTASGGGGALDLYYVTNIYFANCNFTNNGADRSGADIGKGAKYGGACMLEFCDGDLNITSCNFTNNVAETGGAIRYAYSSLKLNMVDSIFRDNKATGTSSFGRGGDIHITRSADINMTIKNSKFIDSHANVMGGSIYCISSGLVLIDSSFTGVTSNGNGVDVYVSGVGSTTKDGVSFTATDLKNVYIERCNFTGTSDYHAVYIGEKCDVDIINSCFKDNAATENPSIYFATTMDSITINDTTFKGNVADNGGAFTMTAANFARASINGCDFINNKAIAGNGGAIYVPTGSNGLALNKCNFTGNNATSGKGGAIYLQANIKDIGISNSVFDKNNALSGGAIHFEAGSSNEFSNIDFTNTDFTNNRATGSDGGAAITFKYVKDVDFDNCAFDGNVANASGALYFDNYYDVYYNKCNFTNNRAANGGAAYYKGQYYKNTTVYEKCVFDRNTANDGGVIYNNGEYLTIRDSNFTNNNASNFGGVIYGQTTSNYLKIVNSSFDNNVARNISNSKQRCIGGVIYTLASHVNVTSTNFTNNGAWSWGGVIMMGNIDSQDNVIQTSDLYVNDCKFINNGANHGGVVNTYQTTNVRIIHSDFKNNYATGKGGALYLTGANGLVDDCTFTGNKAVNGSAIIYIPPPEGTVPPTKSNITNCKFIANNATGNATLWFESSEGKISNCNFTNNTAKQAGAIKINTLKVTTDYNNFIGNNATNGDAGAIYVTSISGQTTISYSNFTNNHAKGDGGAVYLASYSGIISNSRFINNTAYNGGAIVIANNNINVSNSYFNGNNATSKGGAIYALAQTGLNVSDSTFEKNHADNGGAIYYQGNNNGLCIYNDNFTGNIAEFNGGAVYYRAYLNNAYVPLSDYLEFSHHGTFDETSKRVTWTENNVNLVFTSLFKDNLDYIMNAAAYNDGLTGYVSVTVPKGARRPNVVVNVTVVGEDGNPVSVPVIYASETEDGDNVIITYRLDDVLTEGKYNATVGFKKTNSPDDDLYLYKEDNVSFTLKNPFEGDFEQLQNLINEVLYNATQGLPAVLNLTRNYNFTENWDVGPLNIYGTITINGNGFWIDAKGHTRIFYINASDVVLNDIVFKNGNANGDNSTSSNKLQGGAILIEANNCKINNCTFTLNNATQGGAVFIQNNATGTIINHSTFTENNATYGTAIYVNGSSNFLINDTQFNSNVAKRGGAVIVQGATGNIANSSFISNEARFDDCAGISITESNHVTVSNVTFSGNTADIYVGQSEDVLLYNLTISNSGTASSSPIYINSNVTIIDLDMSNWNSENAIIFYSGNSTVSDSTFDGSNPILIGSGAEVHLTGVNNTNNNGDYSVDNSGKLYLKDNNFTNVINNHGNIETNTTIRILDNQTIVLADGENFKLNITMFDDNGNIIKDSRLKLYSNTIEVAKTFNNDGYYYSAEKAVTQGVYAITANANELGLTNVDYQTALIKVKTHDAAVELNISKINHGEKVVFKANVTPSSTTGNVTFYLEGIEFGAKLNYTMDINETTGIATLTLKNLTQDTYRVTAVYNGDDTHFPSDPTEGMLLIVLQLDSKVQIKVNSTIQGNDVIAVITSNATTGTVNVTFKGVTMELPVDENGTATWNLTEDFTLAPDTYSIQAYFNENDYYKASLSTTTFQVYEYDIKVEVNETQFNESATIKVTINPVEAQGKTPVIYVDGVQVTHVDDLGSGVFIATTDKLTEVKEHNVNVTYEGNGTLFPAKEVTTTFNVTKAKDYAFDITVTPQNPKFGENVTVNITGPAGLKVNVTIDDDTVEVTLNENGTAIIKRDNLTAGPHTIKANTTGNENYSSNDISKDFTIEPADPAMTINVTQPIAPTSPANVTVTIGKNATGTVIIYIDGKIYDSVEVKDGVAVVDLDTTVPGNYTVTAKYYSDDDNYKSASNMTGARYVVDRYDIAMNYTMDVTPYNNVTVVVKVNDTAKGNVTILFNGQNHTAPVENGIARVNLGVIDDQKRYDVVAAYTSNDTKFNNGTLPVNFTVSKLNNLTIEVTVSEAQFGDNATITIKLPADATSGTLNVTVNGTEYLASHGSALGVWIVTTPALPIGSYPVNVTYTGDTKYADGKANDTLTVKTNSSYAFDVVVTPAPYGQNTTVNITGPANEVVTVAIDGIEQNVTLDENGTYVITLNNLTAGTHNVTAVVADTQNYTSKPVTRYFPIGQATPSMEIIVPTENIAAGSAANVTVVVGNNATGDVIIYINNVPNVVEIINGTAVLPINTTKAGTFNVTAKYAGDANYTAGENNVAKNFTVNKYNITMTYIGADITTNNNVTFIVQLNETDAKGTVVITINGKNYTGEVKNGTARVNVGVLAQSTTEYRFVANYTGDTKYNTTSVNVNVTVGKLRNGTMTIDVSPTQFGDNTTITVTIPDVKDGNVTVWVNNTPYNATIVSNGVYQIVTPALPKGDYPVNVTYTNGSKYADFNGTSSLSVKTNSSYAFDVNVTPAPYGENTTFTVTVTAPTGIRQVNVTVDNVTYPVDINSTTGIGILKLDNLTAGKHVVIANFTGNNNYTAKVASKTFDIDRNVPNINITVEQNVAAGSNVLINVTINDDAKGSVNIIVDGKDNVVEIKDGKANVTAFNVSPGKHNITVKYMGDLNYNETSKDASFHAGAYDTQMDVTGIEADENNNVTVIVKINDDATGNITVTIGDKNYTGEIINGTARVNIGNQTKGPLEINVTYKGDDNYNATNITRTVNVPGLKNYTLPLTKQDISYGANATVTVTLPEGARKENLTFYVDGKPVTTFDYNETTRVATLTIVKPEVGTYTVKAVYAEDSIYAEKTNETSFTVASADPGVFDISFEPAQPVDVGKSVNVIVTLPGDANGTVTLNFNGTKYVGDLVNGVANITVPNLGNGTHNFTATYSGDKNYNSIDKNSSVQFNKVVPVITVNATDITLGEVAVINVTLPSDASGTVTVKVDGINKTVAVVGGLNSIEISGITVGTKLINVTYNGNGKYASASNADKQITVKSVETEIISIEPEFDDNNNATIVVKVPEGATGNVTVKIGDKNYTANVTGGVARVNVGILNETPVNINVTYNGDENYTSATNLTSINVPALVNYTLPMTKQDIDYGANATVTVTLPEGAKKQNLTFYVDGTPVTGFEYNETTCVATLTIVNPKAGNHTVRAKYSDDGKYADNENSTTFTVNNVKPDVFDVVINPIEVGQTAIVNVTLPEDAKGTVTVVVNGTKYTGDVVNGTAIITIPNLGNGTHPVNVTYSGDANYNSTSKLDNITVNKVDPQIKVNVSDITLGDVAYINVTLPKDATGTVTVLVDGQNVTVPVNGGLVSIPVSGITVGTKDINVTYNGNDKYASQSNTDKNVTVSSVVTEIISIEPEFDDNNNATIVVKVPEGATGNVTVKIGDKNYTANVTGGVARVNVGVLNETPVDINVTYSGDENYTSANNLTAINVPALVNYTLPMTKGDIDYGANATVTVTLPEGARKENLTFIVDGTPVTGFEYNETTRVATLTIVNPKAGDHTVTAKYSDDGKYSDNENSTTFTVNNVEPKVFDVVINPIEVGQTAIVNVTLPEDAKGTVTVVVNGTKYTGDVVNGTAIITIPNLGNGTHPVNVTYSGDSNYNSTSKLDNITVNKVDPQIKVNVSDITLGDVAYVNVTLPKDATGTVTVLVDGQNVTVPVNGGLVSIPVSGITVGTKDINVTYNGNGKYASQSNTDKNITVSSVVTEIISIEPEFDDNNNATIVIKVPEGATGNVTVKIGDKNYTANVTDGVARVNVGILNETPVAINVTYSGDENYTSANNLTSIIVPSLVNYTLPMTTKDIDYGANATVEVKLPEGARKENLTFIVDGTPVTGFEYNETTRVATLTIVNPKAGNHTVKVKYSDDGKYADNENSTTFTVNNVEPKVFDVVINPIEVGQTAIVNVTLPEDAKGTVTVVVNGTKYTGDVVNGTAIITIPNLGNGTHPVNVTYSGDSNYNSTSKLDNITVNKVDPQIKVNVSDITLGDVAYVNVTLPKDATGTVTVLVDGQNVTVPVNGGLVSIPVSGITVGTKDINVTYNGNGKYASQSNTDKNITVSSVVTEIISIEPEFDDNNNATIVVKVPEGATGNVTVKIGDKNYTANVTDGIARVNVGVLNETPVAINVTYSGDENYTSANNLTSIIVPSLVNYTLPMTVQNIDYGANATVTVKLPEGARKENLTFYVDGVATKAFIYNETTRVATLTIVNPKAGNHTVKVKYSDDGKYSDNENSTTFTVNNVKPDVFNVVINPIEVGQTAIVNVTLPEDAKGTVTVVVNGTKYTGDVVNGTAIITIPNLGNGTHPVNVTYSGDSNYNSTSKLDNITVNKVDPQIKVNVSDITLGDVAYINVTLPKDATGTVTVLVDGQNVTVPVNGGLVSIPVSGITVGTKDINVTYNGNDKYASQSNTDKNITVSSVVTEIISIEPEFDDNNNATIVVKVPEGATGNVTVKIGDKNYTANVTDGVARVNIGNQTKGTHDINVTYSGDENYTSASNVTSISVPALKNYTLPMTTKDIDYGANATVEVKLPEGARYENLTFYVDGVETKAFKYNETTGIATLTVVNPKAGNHTVKVTYAEDSIYADNENSTSFEVSSVEPDVFDVVIKPIDVGETAVVNVTLPEDATGTVTVEVNGTKYTADVVNGSAIVNIPKLGNGTHAVNITYSGDGNYNSVNNETSITVSKVDPQIRANTTDITLGENAVINVTLPGDATGTVTVVIGNINKTVGISGGQNSIIVEGVPVGTYDNVEVTYNGDDKYLVDTTTTKLTVNPKKTTEDDIKVIDNGDGTVTVIVPDNATGNITVKIGDETLPAVNLTGGRATINLTNSSQKPGKHNITVSYSGDENHTGVETNSTGVIPKWNSSINATSAELIRQGDDLIVTVDVTPKDASGIIRVLVNGTGYFGKIDKGQAVITVPGLKEGKHNIEIIYDGDDYYNGNTTSAEVTVQAPIKIDVNGTGNSSHVDVKLPENGTDNVTVLIDGEKRNYTIENRTVKANLTGIEPGVHIITVIYTDQYNNTSVVNSTITVPRWSSSVNATAVTIREGDVENVVVRVGSSDMDGLVFVDIEDTGYYANITNGEVTILAPGLTAGKYLANVTYLGNWKYEPSNNTFEFIVETPIVINVEGAGNSTELVIDLPVNGTENVTVYVDGNEVPVNFVNGTAVADLSGIPVGEHNVSVVYVDKDGNPSYANATITIFDSINSADMIRGWASPYDFEAEFLNKEGHVLENTQVLIKVNGQSYYVMTDNKGIAKLTTSHLAVGKYDVELVNPVTGETAKQTLTIVERLIGGKDITMDYADGSTYVVRAIGDDGKPVGAGEVVGFRINGVEYNGITDKNGYARLTINLNPKKYTITAQYAGYKVSNKIVVKQTLKLVKKTVTVKKGKKLVLKAKLKWSSGKAIKGKKIKFTFKGKTYTAKTNKKGIAKVTIKAKVTKKLKAGKKYAYSAKYLSNIVKGKVKVKK